MRVCRHPPSHSHSQSQSSGVKSRGQFLQNTRWPQHHRLKIGFIDSGSIDAGSNPLTFAERKAYVRHIVQTNLHPYINLEFVWLSESVSADFVWMDGTETAQPDIRITFASADGAFSYIGTDAQSIAQNVATMNLGWLDHPIEHVEDPVLYGVGTVILHEFGHALGLIHEHQSYQFPYNWNEQAILDELTEPPNDWTEEEIKANVFDQIEGTNGTEYDPLSIMHYYFPPEYIISSHIFTRNTVFSELDHAVLHRMYPVSATHIAAERDPQDLSWVWGLLGAVAVVGLLVGIYAYNTNPPIKKVQQ